tara:strand:+ start:1344 stop:1703 length:360 start_codon:yes stop_codon:yes gene_type:complete
MLGGFQKTVLIVALVILILCLSLIAIMLVVQSKNSDWPPYSSTCPDYWNLESIPGSDDGEKCVNQYKLGKTSVSGCNVLIPDASIFKGSDGECNKYSYAKKCQITWDGITNNRNLIKDC